MFTVAMMTKATCLDLNSFDLATTASAYSVLSGVLAGIAFLSITYVLTDRAQIDRHTGHGEYQADHILIALFCATFGLVIATLQYAILAGEANAGLQLGRAASEELFADISFIAAILTLVYGLVLLLAAGDFHRADATVRVIASAGAPALSVFFLAGCITEIAVGAWTARGNGAACGTDGFYRVASNGEILAPLLVMLASCLLWVLPKALPGSRRLAPWAFVARHRDLLSATGLIVVFVSAALGTSLDQYDPSDRLSTPSSWLLFGSATTFFLFQATLIRFSSGWPEDAESAQQEDAAPGPSAADQITAEAAQAIQLILREALRERAGRRRSSSAAARPGPTTSVAGGRHAKPRVRPESEPADDPLYSSIPRARPRQDERLTPWSSPRSRPDPHDPAGDL